MNEKCCCIENTEIKTLQMKLRWMFYDCASIIQHAWHMVMHLYSAFSMWIYSNALYNTLLVLQFLGDFARLLHGAVHNLFNVTSSINRYLGLSNELIKVELPP